MKPVSIAATARPNAQPATEHVTIRTRNRTRLSPGLDVALKHRAAQPEPPSIGRNPR
jgi:hypothetical protein